MNSVVCVHNVEVLLKYTHWADTGFFNELRHALRDLIPWSGSVDQPRKNRHLERFRKAENVVYDLYNNGLCNRASEASALFNISTSWYKIYRGEQYGRRYENSMYCVFELLYNMTLLMAAAEQKLITRDEFDFYRFIFLSYCQLLKVRFESNKVHESFCNF